MIISTDLDIWMGLAQYILFVFFAGWIGGRILLMIDRLYNATKIYLN